MMAKFLRVYDRESDCYYRKLQSFNQRFNQAMMNKFDTRNRLETSIMQDRQWLHLTTLHDIDCNYANDFLTDTQNAAVVVVVFCISLQVNHNNNNNEYNYYGDDDDDDRRTDGQARPRLLADQLRSGDTPGRDLCLMPSVHSCARSKTVPTCGKLQCKHSARFGRKIIALRAHGTSRNNNNTQSNARSFHTKLPYKILALLSLKLLLLLLHCDRTLRA